MPNLDKAITASVEIISVGGFNPVSFDKYSKSYLFTTESIKEYLLKEEYNKERALTVLSSGDQIFNLACMGVKYIDAFDINELSYYIYWLKYAIIKEFSFEEFKFLNTSSHFYVDNYDNFIILLRILKKYLPIDVYNYWTILSERFKENPLFIENLFLNPFSYCLKEENIYISSKEEYDKMKRNLEQININLYFADARVIPGLVNKKYDLILLSNISDYLGTKDTPLTMDEFKKYIASYYELLDEDGLIINYLYGARYYSDVIANSKISKKDLGLENINLLKGGTGYYKVRKKKVGYSWN